MFPNFLPQEVNLLHNRDSIALARKIQRTAISIPSFNRPIFTAYVKLGTGKPPILLIHGFDSSLLEFRHLIPLLTVNETWAIDLLGSGFTERPNEIIYQPTTIAEHLYHTWRTLIARPVVVVGASMGGATAIDFTLTHPEAVAKLILINSVGYGGSFPIGQLLPEPIIELGVEFWRARRSMSLFWGTNLGLLDSKIEDAIRCAALPSLMPGWEKSIKDFTRSGGYYRLAKNLASVDRPTLILWGERDDVLGTEAAGKFNQAIANSKLVWLPGVGHSPQWERPKLVATQISEFLNSVSFSS